MRLEPLKKQEDSQGFSLIEVMISMAITVIVMGAVFSLLTRGQQSFQREPQIADMQQSARNILDMVSKDILQAGAGLPPEFPSITPNTLDATVGNMNPDVLQIVGGSQAVGEMFLGAEPVTSFDGTIAQIDRPVTYLQVDDLVVLYNNHPFESDWMMGEVTDIVQNPTQVFITIDSTNTPSGYTENDAGFPWANVKISRVSVVRYFTQLQESDLILMRQVDFGTPMPVGLVDDFQVAYLVGNSPPVEQDDPPHPHPTDGIAVTAADIISGVRITVVARSAIQNLMGSTEGDSGNYLRKSFSSNISPRNISAGLAERTGEYQ